MIDESTTLDQNVIGASSDLQVVFIGTVGTQVVATDDIQDRLGDATAASLLWVSYTDGDMLNVDGSEVDNVAAFEAALFDTNGFDQDALLFEAQDRDDDDADTIYNLITDDFDTTSDFLLSGVANDGESNVVANSGDDTVTVTVVNVFEDALTGFGEGDFSVTVEGADADITSFERATNVYTLGVSLEEGESVVVTVDGVTLTEVAAAA